MINKKGISLHPQSSNNDGAIAQLVEQRTENPCVPGSIPGGTTFLRVALTKSDSFLFLLVPYLVGRAKDWACLNLAIKKCHIFVDFPYYDAILFFILLYC